MPSNRFVISPEFTTTTEFPGIYAKPWDTVRSTKLPVTGVIVAEVETVKNLSPERPVAPVGPLMPSAPVAPVDPWGPVGPSIPSRFTLYMAAPEKSP